MSFSPLGFAIIVPIVLPNFSFYSFFVLFVLIFFCCLLAKRRRIDWAWQTRERRKQRSRRRSKNKKKKKQMMTLMLTRGGLRNKKIVFVKPCGAHTNTASSDIGCFAAPCGLMDKACALPLSAGSQPFTFNCSYHLQRGSTLQRCGS